MDFEFTLNEYDRPVAEFSTGFEALGRWITEELAADQDAIDGLLDILQQVSDKRVASRQLFAEDMQLNINAAEVEVIALALGDDYADQALPEDTQFYDDESHAVCGLPDFLESVLAWRAFALRQ